MAATFVNVTEEILKVVVVHYFFFSTFSGSVDIIE